MKKFSALFLTAALLLSLLTGCVTVEIVPGDGQTGTQSQTVPADPSAPAGLEVGADGKWQPAADIPFTAEDIPAYTGEPYVVIHDNLPYFNTAAVPAEDMEYYSPLDELDRCGATWAVVGRDLMPTEKRGDISAVHPSGWINHQYDHVDGKSLYNRCHLIGFQLAGENANERNLITGTRTMNVKGMLPFENMVADFVKEDGGHVAYRVTPVFAGDELVARGVVMEGWSLEDDGETVAFCVFAHNIEPGVAIDYATGENWAGDPTPPQAGKTQRYVLNTSSRKFHDPSCTGVDSIGKDNRRSFTGTRQELIDQGYEPCKRCNP